MFANVRERQRKIFGQVVTSAKTLMNSMNCGNVVNSVVKIRALKGNIFPFFSSILFALPFCLSYAFKPNNEVNICQVNDIDSSGARAAQFDEVCLDGDFLQSCDRFQILLEIFLHGEDDEETCLKREHFLKNNACCVPAESNNDPRKKLEFRKNISK